MPTTLEQLYTPLAAPAPLGEAVPQPGQVATQPSGSPQTWGTQQQSDLVTALMGTGTTDVVTPKSGTTGDPSTTTTGDPPPTTPPPPKSSTTASTTEDQTFDWESASASETGDMTSKMLGMENVGSNVAGVVDSEGVDRTVKNVEAVYEEDKLLATFKGAEEGFERTKKTHWGQKKGKVLTGSEAARQAKVEDRKYDREKRNKEYKDCKRTAGSKAAKKACKDVKKSTRTAERKQRRDVFDEYQQSKKKDKKGDD